MDVTLAFRHRNTFTTKKMFTFGIRNVAMDTCHVYQTKAYPLLVYLPKPHVHLSHETRTFCCTTYSNYVPYLLPPNSVVKLQHPIFYVLLTAGKVLFAVDVVHVHTIPEIEMAHGIIIQDQLQPLSPPKPKPSPWTEGPSVIPLPVEWDKKSGQMKPRTTPPPSSKFAAPPSPTAAPPPKFAPFARPAPTAAPASIEPRPGPSWELSDWEKSEKEKKLPITIMLSDDEEEEIFIARPALEAPPEQPVDIISSPDFETLLNTFMSDLGEEEVYQILNYTENYFEFTSTEPVLQQATESLQQTELSLVQQALNTTEITEELVSEVFDQHVITDFKTIDFQDLYDCEQK